MKSRIMRQSDAAPSGRWMLSPKGNQWQLDKLYSNGMNLMVVSCSNNAFLFSN